MGKEQRADAQREHGGLVVVGGGERWADHAEPALFLSSRLASFTEDQRTEPPRHILPITLLRNFLALASKASLPHSPARGVRRDWNLLPQSKFGAYAHTTELTFKNRICHTFAHPPYPICVSGTIRLTIIRSRFAWRAHVTRLPVVTSTQLKHSES
jgi:hypothetical protein